MGYRTPEANYPERTFIRVAGFWRENVDVISATRDFNYDVFYANADKSTDIFPPPTPGGTGGGEGVVAFNTWLYSTDAARAAINATGVPSPWAGIKYKKELVGEDEDGYYDDIIVTDEIAWQNPEGRITPWLIVEGYAGPSNVLEVTKVEVHPAQQYPSDPLGFPTSYEFTGLSGGIPVTGPVEPPNPPRIAGSPANVSFSWGSDTTAPPEPTTEPTGPTTGPSEPTTPTTPPPGSSLFDITFDPGGSGPEPFHTDYREGTSGNRMKSYRVTNNESEAVVMTFTDVPSTVSINSNPINLLPNETKSFVVDMSNEYLRQLELGQTVRNIGISLQMEDTYKPPPSNVGPNAEFSLSLSNLTAEFTDQSSDTDGTIVRWRWDFGDGTTSDKQNPSHTYSSESTYPVRLTVWDNAGSSDSTTKNAIISSNATTTYRLDLLPSTDIVIPFSEREDSFSERDGYRWGFEARVIKIVNGEDQGPYEDAKISHTLSNTYINVERADSPGRSTFKITPNLNLHLGLLPADTDITISADNVPDKKIRVHQEAGTASSPTYELVLDPWDSVFLEYDAVNQNSSVSYNAKTMQHDTSGNSVIAPNSNIGQSFTPNLLSISRTKNSNGSFSFNIRPNYSVTSPSTFPTRVSLTFIESGVSDPPPNKTVTVSLDTEYEFVADIQPNQTTYETTEKLIVKEFTLKAYRIVPGTSIREEVQTDFGGQFQVSIVNPTEGGIKITNMETGQVASSTQDSIMLSAGDTFSVESLLILDGDEGEPPLYNTVLVEDTSGNASFPTTPNPYTITFVHSWTQPDIEDEDDGGDGGGEINPRDREDEPLVT